MKVNIVAVGKIKEKFYLDATSEYAKRLSKFCELKIIEVPEKSSESNVAKKIEDESALLLAAAKGTIVLTDRMGKQVSSPELSELIASICQTNSTISFIIGGSNGVSQALKNAANFCISFGKITFPHQLFRVVLAEQIYRAFAISAGLPYHK